MNDKTHKKSVLAGGCFWGLEDLLRTQPGVIDTEAGYCGGEMKIQRMSTTPVTPKRLRLPITQR